MKVVHIITGLKSGGAETMLYRLLAGFPGDDAPTAWRHSVISLTGLGPMADPISDLGVEVRALGMRPGSINPAKLLRLIAWLKDLKPDVVQTWMYHADLIGGLAAKFAGNLTTIWNIRHANLEKGVNRPHTLITAKVCARLSRRLPAKIVCNSETGMEMHAAAGYARERFIVIPNGFETDTFRPDTAARSSLRSELGIPDEGLLIGLIGRYDRQKDHDNFLRAARILAMEYPNANFLLSGTGITMENPALAEIVLREQLGKRVHLLGQRSDMPRINAGLDIACSSSLGEGFPNSIGEAMSCGTPCVVTNVGDSAVLVGQTGIVVPPRDPVRLAEGILSLIREGGAKRRALGSDARERIVEKFGIARIRERYRDLYLELHEYGGMVKPCAV